MGGNALKHVKCIRINKFEYNNIKNDILSKLKDLLNINALRDLPDKESFGDLDLIYTNNSINNVLQLVISIFNPIEIEINGNVLSFSYVLNVNDYFQIDLIKVKNYDMANFYMSYGDIGNILGRIIKKQNLTFGHEGMWLNYKNNKIILLDNPKEICDFLELDYNKWEYGFNDMFDIFNWIINCKYFNKNIFNISKLNSTYRHRLITRPMFLEFYKYIENIDFKEKEYKIITDEEYINMFNKNKELDEINKYKNIEKLYQNKFSGLIFLEYIDKKKINIYKDEFIKYISKNNNFDEWLSTNDQEYINKTIKSFIDVFNF